MNTCITGHGNTLYIEIAMVFVFSLYIRKFPSCFQFQVKLTFNDFTAQNMSKVICVHPFPLFICRLCIIFTQCHVSLLMFDSLSQLIASLWKGRVYKDGYRDQIVTSCGCVSAFQDTFTVHVAQ